MQHRIWTQIKYSLGVDIQGNELPSTFNELLVPEVRCHGKMSLTASPNPHSCSIKL